MSKVYLADKRRGFIVVLAAFSPFARVRPVGSMAETNAVGITLRVGATSVPLKLSFHEGDEGTGAQLLVSDPSAWLVAAS